MSYFVKIILIVVCIGALIGGLTYFVGLTGITAQLSHLNIVFGMIAGNAYNLNDTIPAVQAMIAVGCVFSVELLIVLFKLMRFLIKLFR